VYEAETSEEALAICHSERQIDALVTDIRLNGSANGWDLAVSFRTARPRISVVYTSGNVRDQSRCVADSVFIDKPCEPVDILNACLKGCRQLPREDP
jgi:CheY-like chemotaxis protein